MTQKYSHNQNSDKTIWIDLDNSPHVPFFAPIISKLQEDGYKVVISARVYAQTVLLANLYNLDVEPIGKHHGKNKLLKIIGLLYRSLQLLPLALKKKPTIAVSHGSRSQMIIARFLRIPIVMFLDYEYIQTIPFVKPKMIFFPNVISNNKLKSFADKIIGYPGIKEDIYVPGFIPDKSSLNSLKFFKNSLRVVLRPSPHEAHYHNEESELLFEKIIEFLVNISGLQTIILPRDDKQKHSIITKYNKYFDEESLIIPNEIVDGLNLMWFSDLVISGGGTMNREATALGVPVYSIFKGKIGDVDKYLEKQGRLILIKNIDDLKQKIRIKRRNRFKKIENINSLALQSVVNTIGNLIAELADPKQQPNIESSYNYELTNDYKKEATQ